MWQKIETAPKDGVYVLVARAGQWVGEARWTEGGGWREPNNDWTDSWGQELHPTHWMPLPAPPTAE
jgi:hypothetical protein